MQRISPLRVITSVLLGLMISLAYRLLSSALLNFLEGTSEAQAFLNVYSSFKTLISLGLVLGAALVVFQSQNVIPKMIETAFAEDQLLKTKYYLHKQRSLSPARSIASAAEFTVIGFIIFNLCQFPLRGLTEVLIIIPACAQYSFGVYVLRKIFYAGMMLKSLLGTTVTRRFFKKRKFLRKRRKIDTYLHMLLMLVMVFGYVYLVGYNEGPFVYESILGESARFLLILPALIAAPVLLILVFYPGLALQQLYDQSTYVEVDKVKKAAGMALGEESLHQEQGVNLSTATKRFRVAFSFAGEKRKHVAQVAAMLAARFGEEAILYDKFHEAEFARRDLGFYLPDLYCQESDLVVVVVCQDYEGKEWCGLEWDAIFDLLKKRKNQEIMLCRFDHALVKGLYSTAGFLELDNLTADQTTARILERLALNDGKPKGYYLSESR